MTLNVPLNVTLITNCCVRRVTRELRDLTFRSTAPGGYAGATFSLDRPLRLKPNELAYYSRVVISGNHGGIVWEGRLEDPGRGVGPDGEIWDITATGSSAHTHDRTVPLIYVDRRLDPWVPSRYNHKAAQVGSADHEDQVASIQIQFLNGTVATTSYIGDVIYHAARDASMLLARVSCDHIEGVTDQNWRIKLHTRTDDGASPGNVVSHQASTTGQALAGQVGDTNFNTAHNVANLRLDRDTAGVTVTDDDTWTTFRNIVVRTQLKDTSGTDITTGYTTNYVLASDVVKDLLGRLLTKYDGPGASIATTTYQIEQLAFPDGIDAAGALDELMRLEPAYYWAAWEQNTAGEYRFEWKQWPSTVRYEATVKGGIDSPGSADGLYNAVTVRWRDGLGRARNTRRTQTVADLDDAGLTREAFLDLSDEIGTSNNAVQAGDQFLEEHAKAPNQGTLVIDRPILDRDTGRMVQPWEILPGFLIRVRGILPSVDALNATDRDGVTVFRVVAVEYNASSATATLELDAFPLTVARALAELRKPRELTRKRKLIR